MGRDSGRTLSGRRTSLRLRPSGIAPKSGSAGKRPCFWGRMRESRHVRSSGCAFGWHPFMVRSWSPRGASPEPILGGWKSPQLQVQAQAQEEASAGSHSAVFTERQGRPAPLPSSRLSLFVDSVFTNSSTWDNRWHPRPQTCAKLAEVESPDRQVPSWRGTRGGSGLFRLVRCRQVSFSRSFVPWFSHSVLFLWRGLILPFTVAPHCSAV